MKKVIVTGGYGFIGSNLIKFLLKKNYFVINLDYLGYSANQYNLRDIKKKNYRFIKTDIGDLEKVSKIVKKFKPKIIFNLAAETHVDRSIDSPRSFIKNNILSFFNFLEVLRKSKKKIKLIHVSTDEVFGDLGKSKISSTEKYPYNPSSPYSASKASADHLLKAYIRTYKINAIITHCSNNYGPNQFPEKLIPKLIYCIIKSKPLPIYGKGENLREWLFVQDHCRALELISKKGKIGEHYNIGSSQLISNLNLTKKIIKCAKIKLNITKKIKIQFVKDRPGHDLKYSLNSNKIKNQLKWKPVTTIDNGIKITVNWYLENLHYFSLIKKKDFKKRLGLMK